MKCWIEGLILKKHGDREVDANELTILARIEPLQRAYLLAYIASLSVDLLLEPATSPRFQIKAVLPGC